MLGKFLNSELLAYYIQKYFNSYFVTFVNIFIYKFQHCIIIQNVINLNQLLCNWYVL